LQSRSEINALGRRLAHTGATLSDLEALSLYQGDFVMALEEVRTALSELTAPIREAYGDYGPLALTTRVKTVATLIDKLRRGTSLSTMQDIVGCRIAGFITLDQQDDIARLVADRFADSRAIDRRERPTQGYRAVHVVVQPGGHRVEVQIRTKLQDQWANWTEKLGDDWGRWLRYGLPAEGPDARAIERRSAFVQLNIQQSDEFYEMDKLLTQGVRVQARLANIDASAGQDEANRAECYAELRDLQLKHEAVTERVHKLWDQSSELLPA
jgi:ppGpp synthetase/RelA/SpoT-type nucleotidyltranferase